MTSQEISELANFSDQELIELMALKDDLSTAEHAFNAFYHRFEKIVRNSVGTICINFDNRHEMIKIIFNNTFFNAYRSAHTFSCDKNMSAADVKNCIIAWLFTIEKNELRGLFKTDTPADKEGEYAAYGRMLQNASIKAGPENYNEKIFRQALSQIPKERDREIFYTYWLYYSPTTSGQAQKLPPDIAKGLSEKFNTTPANIRQIIVRTKKIVFAFIKENYKKVTT
ncbi:MAG: hypothetical protein QM802_20590 [Agriterribacter sp.]